MKTFREYLTESKKVYNFKVKVAGELPENFETDLKSRLEKYNVINFNKMMTTPVQKVPLDFPNVTNKEVTVYEVILEYPVTSPELINEIKDMGLTEACFRVRGSEEPSELEQLQADNELSGEALLDETDLDKGNGKINHKDYFGDDFNKSFLKDLSKAAKERCKEEGKGEYKLPKVKDDKAGNKSAIGS